MLFLGLKRCVFHTQIRQIVILNVCNRYQTRMKVLHYGLEYKGNQNLTNYKLIHTNPEREEQKVRLPQLMWSPNANFSFSLFNIIYSYCDIRLTIDRDFKLLEFTSGATQAISVISNALATQNYEMLDGMVTERAIKVLKRRVNLLTPKQRSLIAISAENTICCPIGIKKLKTEDENEAVIEVTVSGLYPSPDYRGPSLQEEPLKTIHEVLLTYVYVFQRRYMNGTGGSWVVKVVNHGSLSGI